MIKLATLKNIFLFCSFIFSLGISTTLQAATLDFTISTSKTGGVVGALNTVGDDLCPANPTAGCDFDDTDNIVRTNDNVQYKFNINVGPTGDNVAITSILQEGMVWSKLPILCNIATSSISGDGSSINPSTLQCDIGYRASFASTFNINAKVLGNNPNGTSSGISSATFIGSSSAPITPSLPNNITITASPRLNLRKSYLTARPEIVNGNSVYMVWYTYWLELWKHDTNGNPADDPEPFLGNEMVQDPISFTEDLSNVSPNAYVNNCYVSYGTSGSYPYNTYNSTYPERSVTNAGSASCSNTGVTATGSVTLTVTGADLSFSHTPTKSWYGYLLPFDRKIAAFGTIKIAIPATDFVAAGGSVSSTNKLSGFNPTSISGISNFLSNNEDTSDNIVARTFTESTSSTWTKTFRHAMTGEQDAGKRWWDTPTTATGYYIGDGLVLPDQTWSTLLSYNNRGFMPDTGVSMCDVIDDRYFEIADRITGDAVYVYGSPSRAPDGSSGTRGVNYIIEYGIDYVGPWPPASYPDSASLKTECTDASVQWFSTTTAARAAGRLTKVRYRNLTGVPSSYGGVIIKHRAKSDVDLAGVPSGTLLSSMATVKNDETWPNWRNCNYKLGAWPAPAHTHNYCGDRLSLARATARIEKTTVPNDLVNDVIAGGVVRYKLAPTFTSVSPTQDTLFIRDILPAGTVYVTGSASSNGAAFPPVVTGTSATGQVLTWNLGIHQSNDPINPIEFDLSIPISTAEGTVFDNIAIIDASSDGAAEALRSDTRSVTVSAPALLTMGQSTSTPLVNQGDIFNYTFDYHNAASTAIGKSDIISVLPYNGDARTPPSNFQGSYTIAPITFSSSSGTAFYSKNISANISNDPFHTSNDFTTGATKWCLPVNFGTALCPNTFTDVTAVRFIDSDSLVAGEDRNFTITFTPTGNAENDVYTNIGRGYGEGVVLRPLSPNVAVRIKDNPIDFGDAPNYVTASHGINNISFGLIADDDTGNYGGNGTDENGNASDDDTEGDLPDDEDGITSFSTLYRTANSYSVEVDVRNGSANTVNIIAWIDFDRNGVFDPDEATTTTASAGTLSFNSETGVTGVASVKKTLTWSNLGTTGADISSGISYIRIRITSDSNINASTPGGFASDGEVEDYQLMIEESGSIAGTVKDENGNAVIGAKVKLVDPNTATIIIDNGVQTIVYELAKDVNGNSIIEATVDTSTGAYNFSNLQAGDYKLIETNPANYSSTNETSDQTGDPVNTNVTDDEIPVTIVAGEADTGNSFIDTIDAPKLALEKVGVLDMGSDGVTNVGDAINYTFTVTNTGNVTLTNVTITDPLVVLSGSPIASMAPNAIDTSYTASYLLKQADIDAGYFENTAMVTAKDALDNDVIDHSDDPQDSTNADTNNNGNPDDPTMTLLPQIISLGLTKDVSFDSASDKDNSGSVTAGDILGYTVTATNTGNQTLSSVEVSDPLISPDKIVCPTLPPAGTCILAGNYLVTVDDSEAGERVNTATAKALGLSDKTVTVTTPVAKPLDSPPVAVDDAKHDQLLGQAVTLQTVINDTDTEDNIDPKTVMLMDFENNPVTSLTVIGEGVWTVDSTSGDITFTPENGFTSDPTDVKYTVKDTTNLESNQAIIRIDYEAPAALIGTVWLDRNKNGVIDADETRKAGWLLKVHDKQGNIVATTTTNASGEYTIIGLIPAEYDVAFYTASGVYVGTVPTQGSLKSGETTSLLLPIDPSGIVYDSSTRTSLANVTLQFLNAQGNLIDASCLGAGQQNQVTATDGLYAFDLLPTAHSSCPDNSSYSIKVVTPPAGYYPDSTIIPVSQSIYDGSANEANCTVDALPNSGSCEVQAQIDAPQLGETTTYFMDFLLNIGDKNIIFNHIPLDSKIARQAALDDNAIVLQKSVNKKQASIGDQVYYEIGAKNTTTSILSIDIEDDLPTGFKFTGKTAVLIKAGLDGLLGTNDDIQTAITATGHDPIRFSLSLNPAEEIQIGYILKLGTSAKQGIAINKAQVYAAGSTTDIASNLATAKIRVIADNVLDQSTIIGKVFHDRDADGYQDSANATGITIRSGKWIKQLGNIKGRVSELDDPATTVKTIRVPYNDKSNRITISTDEGSVFNINHNDQIIEMHTGLKAKGLSSQDLRIRIKHIANTREITLLNYGINEEGIPGVRIATVEGLLIETDSFGRYHLPEVEGGKSAFGKNTILKVDDSTLPEGAKFTTENPRVLRITRSALNKINFGIKLPRQAEPPKNALKQNAKYRVDTHRTETTQQVPTYQMVEVKMGSIFFDRDQYSIREDQRGVMADIAAKIERYGSGHITIDSYTDSRHTATYNIELAKKRANTVRNALKKRLGSKLMQKVQVVIDKNAYKEVPHNDSKAIDYKEMGFF